MAVVLSFFFKSLLFLHLLHSFTRSKCPVFSSFFLSFFFQIAPLSQNMPSNEANNIDVLLSGILQVRLKSNCWGSPAKHRYTSQRNPPNFCVLFWSAISLMPVIFSFFFFCVFVRRPKHNRFFLFSTRRR